MELDWLNTINFRMLDSLIQGAVNLRILDSPSRIEKLHFTFFAILTASVLRVFLYYCVLNKGLFVFSVYSVLIEVFFV